MNNKDKQGEQKIVVEIPVVLKKANFGFNMDHLAFAGDVPVDISFMPHLTNQFQDMNTKGQIVGVFYGYAAYITLNNEAYNAFRKVITGIPYKVLLAELINQGVQIDEYVISMKNHTWVTKDLSPGVNVTAGAVSRLIQLTREGFVHIQP